MNTAQRAYLAGLVDGEGCICISKNHPIDRRGKVPRMHIQYNLELTITNTNLRIIRWLSKYADGRRVSKGRKLARRKIAYNWRATSREHLKQLLENITPFLQAKRKQAAIAQAFMAMGDVSNPSKREKFYLKMRALNFRGQL
jgi:hypothetical protein